MGTNYYWHESGKRTCPECGSETKSLHIGKSSAGWCFSLHVHHEHGIGELPDWCEKWKSGAIFNEYGEPVSVDAMIDTITNRAGHGVQAHSAEWLTSNYATEGPNGLVRHGYSAKPGDGTYDLVTGEFS